jgi:hypothetical protein
LWRSAKLASIDTEHRSLGEVERAIAVIERLEPEIVFALALFSCSSEVW